ncbi:hypothetical protein EDF67_10883 [Sphingobacterium sp. JUb78]|nr:hypothetical protein [Sphingobacterium kitahiroshimense]TCR07805.1 hypothetical protein EDF67_10883 [Sphingobacterium sp. JUb78]
MHNNCKKIRELFTSVTFQKTFENKIKLNYSLLIKKEEDVTTY